jgi:pimeloyl-ACP methyl ester carboxylesterase
MGGGRPPAEARFAFPERRIHMTAPVIVPQLRFATTRLETGVQIHYAEQGDPGGQVLVFVHGYPDSWFSYSRLLPLLDPARYHAYAIDQRGFGDSERPADGYAIDDFAADVTSLLDAVGADRATLVGHSMGTFVARRVAQTHPERVARLVLIGSAVTPVNGVTLELQETVRTLQDPVSPEFAREFAASCVHVPVPEPFFERAVAECLKPPSASGGARSTACSRSTTRRSWGRSRHRRCSCGASRTRCSHSGRSRSAWRPRSPTPG